MGGTDTLKIHSTINPNIKAIVARVYTESSEIENYNKFGFSAALTKPFLFKTLKAILDELMKN